MSLLESWLQALVDGHLRAQFGIPSAQRARTVSVISAMACIGLLNDRLEVNFDELIQWSPEKSHRDPDICYPPSILAELKERVPGLPDERSEACWRTTISRFADLGEQLGLVQVYYHKVRFPHSILQSYLGSSFLDAVQQGPEKALEVALTDPGRELLIALIMRSRRNRRMPAPQRATVDLLLKAAEGRGDDKALDLYAAALEIDTGLRMIRLTRRSQQRSSSGGRSSWREMPERWTKRNSGWSTDSARRPAGWTRHVATPTSCDPPTDPSCV